MLHAANRTQSELETSGIRLSCLPSSRHAIEGNATRTIRGNADEGRTALSFHLGKILKNSIPRPLSERNRAYILLFGRNWSQNIDAQEGGETLILDAGVLKSIMFSPDYTGRACTLYIQPWKKFF